MKNQTKNGFLFFNNWSAMIESLDTLMAGKLIQTICHYATTGEIADIDPTAKAIFLSIKPIMDENTEKYEARVKQLSEARQKIGHTDTDKKNTVTVSEKTVTEKKNIETVGVNVNVKDNVSTNVDIYNVGQPDQTNKKSELKSDLSPGMTTDVTQIVDYLNEKTQSNFKAKTDNTKKAIIARLKEGYTVEDFKKVIDSKTNEWLNDSEMRSYLRPSTLFRPANFEAYLNEANRPRPTPKKEKPNPFNEFEQNSHDWDDLEKKLFANL